MKYEINSITLELSEKDETHSLIEILKKTYGLEKNNIKYFKLLKRSIDSRNKSNIKLLYNIEIETDKNIDETKYINVKKIDTIKKIIRIPKNLNSKIAIIGMGPAGIFAALRLMEYGFKPIIFERGDKIEERSIKVDKFWEKGILDIESNVQFGEGGAGTFSDGKLTTRIKSEYIQKVFEEFVNNGAPKEIMYDFKPHIGTDILKNVIINIRKNLEKNGIEINFNSKLTDLKIKNDKIDKIVINNTKEYDVDYVITAIGHSARDTHKMLYEKKIDMESKDFAVGFRIEHPRDIIDEMQYGKSAGHKKLGAASYSFTYNDKITKKGVFTFCMCPGGEVINSASIENTSLTNGMSYHSRNGKFSNAAVVCSVGKDDYGNNIFAGMNFQEELERKTYSIINGYGALCQNLFDYIEGKDTKKEIDSSYKNIKYNYDINNILPEKINKNIKNAFKSWERNKYFVSSKANIIGLETRTSSPIRITRNIKGESTNICNLFPIGEGAGYAGGIVSAAVDGIKIVDNNFTESGD